MNSRRKFLAAAIIAATILQGCSTTGWVDAPCYDGWTQTSEWKSRVLPSSSPLFGEIVSRLPNRQVICIHQTDEMHFIAVVRDGKGGNLGAINLKFENGQLDIAEENIIV